MPLPARSVAVVGADYPNKRGPTRRFEIALCLPGEPVQLVPEFRNPADSNAIMVLSARSVLLGYLPAERAPFIGGIMKQGREVLAIFQEKTDFGAFIRVAFDGEVPTLPAANLGSRLVATDAIVDEDPGFYPDPIYDD